MVLRKYWHSSDEKNGNDKIQQKENQKEKEQKDKSEVSKTKSKQKIKDISVNEKSLELSNLKSEFHYL